MTEQTKPWYKSKGVVSGFLTAIVGVLVATGVLTPEAGSTENIDFLSNEWVNIATGVTVIITGVVGVIGRIKATTKISRK